MLTVRAVETIWNHYQGYTLEKLDFEELSESVRENLILAGRVLERGTSPTFNELDAGRRLGVRRATIGVPLESVAQAYRSTERILLMDLMVASKSWPNDLRDQRVEMVLSIFDLLTDHMINSYRETASRLDDSLRRREEQFIHQIMEKRTLAELETSAKELGLDPNRPCVSVALVFDDSETSESHRVQMQVLEALNVIGDGRIVSREKLGTIIFVFSPKPGNDVFDSLQTIPLTQRSSIGWSVGVGQSVPNISYAARSIEEARESAEASALFDLGRVVRHNEVLAEVLLAACPRLAEQFAQRLEPLAEHRPLIDTLEALFRHGLSQSAAARELYVHVNTVAYRLRRIEALLGLNPLNVDHLVITYLGLRWIHRLQVSK